MNDGFSAEQLAEAVNGWCEQHQVFPANGQSGERMSVRNVRYYRALGLLDPPSSGGGQGFGEKHRLQLVAIRLLQAQGLPLNRIQALLFGRSVADLERISRQGLAEREQTQVAAFQPAGSESWCVTALNEEFMVVSRQGRALAPELRARLLNVLSPSQTEPGQARQPKRNLK